MGVIQDSEYVLYKAFARHIKTELSKPLNKLNLKCFAEFAKFEKKNALFMNCETYEDLGDSSKKVRAQKQKLFELLAIQDRINRILERNEQRLEFVCSKLSQMGIYNDEIDKKTLASELLKEQKNINEKSLNLNPKENNGVIFKYFSGEILAFKEDVLDFSLEENRDVLMNGSSDFFHEVIFTFPYVVATIPDEIFMLSGIKNKILKECVLFVASKLKVQSIYESNKELGSLLENAGNISDISEFARELRNYFNVVVKQCIKNQAPELSVDVDLVLKCDESSEFLPIERRVAIGEKTMQNSEDVDLSENKIETTEKSEVEKETEKVENDTDGKEKPGLSVGELKNLLLSDEDDDEFQIDENIKNEERKSEKIESIETVNNETAEEDSKNELERTLKELEEMLLADEEDDDEKGDLNG